MRSASAFEAALRAFAAELILAALVVAWMRWTGRYAIQSGILIALPFAAATLAASVTFAFTRPSLTVAAARLDRLAHTSEHLTTWLFLSDPSHAARTATQDGFRSAQRDSAMRVAASIQLNKHLPLTWPAWSRAIWIAMILLLSALVTPPRHIVNSASIERAPEVGVSAASAGARSEKSAAPREVPRVQILAPAQMRKLELMATDPQLSTASKRDALKELNEAIGGIPEGDLTPEVRELLDLLRTQTASVKSDKDAAGALRVSTKHEPANSNPAAPSPAEYTPFQNVEQAWASSAADFEDVRTRLAAYYAHHH